MASVTEGKFSERTDADMGPAESPAMPTPLRKTRLETRELLTGMRTSHEF